jgi:hypothetical protein
LAYEVRAAGISAVQQYGAKVHYRDILAGEYFVDLLIDDQLSESDRSATMPTA